MAYKECYEGANQTENFIGLKNTINPNF